LKSELFVARRIGEGGGGGGERNIALFVTRLISLAGLYHFLLFLICCLNLGGGHLLAQIYILKRIEITRVDFTSLVRIIIVECE
jgi:hypothetical protein